MTSNEITNVRITSNVHDACKRERDELQAEVERLQAALEVLAEAAHTCDADLTHDGYWQTCPHDLCRQAAEALVKPFYQT